MSDDESSIGIREQIAELEAEYGIEFPQELEMRMLESGFQELALEHGDSVPSGIRRTLTLSSLNRIYGGMRDSIQSVNEMLDHVPDEELDDDELEQVERGLLRTFMADDILIFFVLAQDTIENLTVDILNEELIDEHYQGTNETMKTLRKRLPQPGCEDSTYLTFYFNLGPKRVRLDPIQTKNTYCECPNHRYPPPVDSFLISLSNSCLSSRFSAESRSS